jgi:hypothetical protein
MPENPTQKHQRSAIRLVEEAVHLLRTSPGMLLSVYYIGGVPFVLGLLYFWADMSRSADAYRHSASAAFGLAMLFVWMKFWQAVYMVQIRARVFDEARSGWSRQRVLSILVTQTLIQSTRLFVIVIASLMVIPFGYCYAFYQNVSAHDGDEGQSIRRTSSWAWRQARLWPRQNHLLICIYYLFGFVIFINVAVTAIVIPQLAKSLLGIESAFTLSGMYMVFNTTFWFSVFGIAYLLLDPFIKATYALRCFYGSAVQSGEDLKSELKQMRFSRKNPATGLLLAFLCLMPMTTPAEAGKTVSPADLDRSIEETMSRREFAWRMPREVVQPQAEKNKGPIAAAIEWLVDLIGRGLKKVGSWIKKIVEWLEDLLPKSAGKAESADGNWMTPIRTVLLILLVLILAILAFIFVRIWQRGRPGPIAASPAVSPSTPDLTDESIKADDLSANRWLAMAAEFAEKSDLRLAMRALYLGTLAHLADRDLIVIELYKSNREYEHELRRRAHEQNELLSLFSSSLSFFERVWYGMYRVARSDYDAFAASHRKIMAYAEK